MSGAPLEKLLRETTAAQNSAADPTASPNAACGGWAER